MTEDIFKIILEEVETDAKDIMFSKNKEYARDKDVLANFKRLGKEFGIDPLQVWAILFTKHVDSIKNFIKTGSVSSSEPIESRFFDARNYLLLGLALLKDPYMDEV